MSDAIITITDRARAVLAFSDELTKVIREIEAEKARHNALMEALLTKEQALEQSIFQLGANNGR